ncbi:hypothetical protein K438DRAFT_1603608, partial [Mycena galopus ATCC 62051]
SSAITRFYAPSDLSASGAGGMYREKIGSNPNWHGYVRYDTVLINVGSPTLVTWWTRHWLRTPLPFVRIRLLIA